MGDRGGGRCGSEKKKKMTEIEIRMIQLLALKVEGDHEPTRGEVSRS